MTQKELNAIFDKHQKEFTSETTEKRIKEAILSYADENGNLTVNAMTQFAFFESVNYSTKMLHKILSDVLVDEQ